MMEVPWAVFNPTGKAVWITMDVDRPNVICAFLRAWCGVVHPEWEEFEAAGWRCVRATITPLLASETV